MDEPIIVSYRWSAKEMVLVQGLHMRYSKQGRKLRRFFVIAGMVFLGVGLAGLIRREGVLTFITPIIAAAGLILGMPIFMRRAALKVYAQKPDRDMLVTYEISSDRLATRSEIANSDILWRAIVRAHRVPEGFIVYPGENAFHWLPLHGFRDPTEIERFALLAKAKAQQYDHAT